MKNIYLILDDNSYFGKQIKFGDLDKNILIEYFKNNNINIETITFSELSNSLDIHGL